MLTRKIFNLSGTITEKLIIIVGYSVIFSAPIFIITLT